MVPDLYVAWHAGKSRWKHYKSLNRYSIGIEINNPGHDFNYKKFSKKQIQSLIKLSKILIKKYKINSKNILGTFRCSPRKKKRSRRKISMERAFKARHRFMAFIVYSIT